MRNRFEEFHFPLFMGLESPIDLNPSRFISRPVFAQNRAPIPSYFAVAHNRDKIVCSGLRVSLLNGVEGTVMYQRDMSRNV